MTTFQLEIHGFFLEQTLNFLAQDFLMSYILNQNICTKHLYKHTNLIILTMICLRFFFLIYFWFIQTASYNIKRDLISRNHKYIALFRPFEIINNWGMLNIVLILGSTIQLFNTKMNLWTTQPDNFGWPYVRQNNFECLQWSRMKWSIFCGWRKNLYWR